MAYLPSFEYDIFISYAHVDNATRKGLKGWVAQFHEELALRLDKRLGRIGEAKVWWDDRLGGSYVFDQTIKRAVSRAAIFLAMTSEGYLASDYCREELDWFCGKAERERPGLFVADRARVLNVLLDDIPHQRWPARYGGTNGFHFYDSELDEPLEVGSKEFRVQLARLTSEVCEILEAMNGAPPEPPGPGPDGAFKVFIADTSSSLKNVRQRVQNELQQVRGVSIVGRVPPPYPAAEHEEEVREQVSAADLCVHLLDATPGREIEDQPEKSYLERQAELSLELARERFVWVPTDLRMEQVEDEAHRGLLRRLEGVTDAGDAGARAGEGGAGGDGELIARPAGDNYKFVRGLSSAVARDLVGHIEFLKKKRAAQTGENGVVRRALLDTHVKDQRHVLELSGFLAEHQIVPLINFDEDTPRKSIESYEDQLRRANLLIVVYGGVPPEWVRERLYEALKFAVTHTQDCPLRACGVYVAPPRKRDEEKRFNVPLLNVDVLDNTERFDPATLHSLLSRIDG
jgi:hypothetical protein